MSDYGVVKKNDSPVETGFPNQLGSVGSSVSTEKILENADGYKRLGLFDEARPLCETIAEDDMYWEDAQFLLIGLDLDQERMSDAANRGLKVLSKGGASKAMVLFAAMAIHQSGDPQKAYGILMANQDMFKDDAEAAYSFACYATKLRELLTKLGYSDQAGVFRHAERKVIFLGDYIDRGPEIRETLQTVRAMVDGGSALAVMGNHEFNALAYATPDDKGGFLRKHTPEKVEQHRATMEQVATPYPEEWKGWLEWFATLPLFLDLGQLRAVHAAWDAEAVKAFQSIKRIDGETLRAMVDKESRLGRFRNHLLNGVELTLPKGHYFTDKAGVKRKDIRTRWWEPLAGKTYSQVVFPRSDTVPDILIPTELAGEDLTYGKDEPPVFIGHYWLPADAPKQPMALNVACLDYSVAKGGELVAYHWGSDRDVWYGKRILSEDSFRSKPIFDKWEMYSKAKEALRAEQEDPNTTPERREEISDDLWSMCEQRLEVFYDLEELAEYYNSIRV